MSQQLMLPATPAKVTTIHADGTTTVTPGQAATAKPVSRYGYAPDNAKSRRKKARKTMAAMRQRIPERPEPLEVTPSLERLIEMLQYCRPHNSQMERYFIRQYIDTLPEVWDDECGNRWVHVGAKPDILWSCHTDTVHRDGGLQTVRVLNGFAFATGSNCLGADDTVGVWLMCEMVRAGIPGLYVFHRGEEVGGIGSTWAAKNLPETLKTVRCAIALDRKGYTSVITQQMGGRCCSDAFAESLARALGGRFKPDDGGTFTDTANYTDLIGECTNLSVGYFSQHGPTECQDLEFAANLRARLITADFSALVYEREPGESDWSDWGNDYGHDIGFWRSRYGSGVDSHGVPYPDSVTPKATNGNGRTLWDRFGAYADDDTDALERKAHAPSLKEFVRRNREMCIELLMDTDPSVIADMLEQQGWDVGSLQDMVAVM